MRNSNNESWCVELCRATLKLNKRSPEYASEVVERYSIVRKITDVFVGRTDSVAAEYFVSSRRLNNPTI